MTVICHCEPVPGSLSSKARKSDIRRRFFAEAVLGEILQLCFRMTTEGLRMTECMNIWDPILSYNKFKGFQIKPLDLDLFILVFHELLLHYQSLHLEILQHFPYSSQFQDEMKSRCMLIIHEF